MFLIEFTYDFYCQGYEDATVVRLVKATSFFEACSKIEDKFNNARDFKNLTIQ